MGSLAIIKEIELVANPTSWEIVNAILEAQRTILLLKCPNSICKVFINKEGKWILRFAKMDNHSMHTVWSKDTPLHPNKSDISLFLRDVKWRHKNNYWESKKEKKYFPYEINFARK